MPLTPLHLAVALPVRKHISMKAFIAVNLLIDVEPVAVIFFRMDEQGYALHGGFHTLAIATLLAVFVWSIGWLFAAPSKPWLYGALFGAWSHVLMDALVHSDVAPFGPFINSNPLYMNLHLELSILCAVVLSYYLALWVRSLGIGEMLSRRFKH